MNSIVESIRRQTGDKRSDEAITFEWGQNVYDAGRHDLFELYPDAAEEYFNMRRGLRDNPFSTAWTGIKSGFADQLPKMGTDLGELAVRGLDAVTPGNNGMLDSAADWLSDQSAKQERQAASKRDPFGVASLEEADTPSDYLNLGSRMIGENLPQIGLSLIPGGIAGGLARSAALKLGTEGALAAGKAAKAAALAHGMIEADAVAAGARATAAAMQAAAGTAAASAIKAASTAAYVSNALQNTADIYSGLDETAKSSGKGIVTSLGGGAVAGALDTIGEALPLAKMFPGMNKKLFTPIVANVLDRGDILGALSSALATGSMEAVTEALQEGVSIASEEYAQGKEFPADVIRSRMINAGFGGGALGLLTGGLAGAFKTPAQDDLRPQAESPLPAYDKPIGPTLPPRPPEYDAPIGPLPSSPPANPGEAEFIGPNEFTGPTQPPVPGDPNFIGPRPFGPVPGQKRFIGPLQPPPPPAPGENRFIGPTIPASPVGATGALDGFEAEVANLNGSPITRVTNPALTTPLPGPGTTPGQGPLNLELDFDAEPTTTTPPPVAVKAVAGGLGLKVPTVVDPKKINKVAQQVAVTAAITGPTPATTAPEGTTTVAPEVVAPQQKVSVKINDLMIRTLGIGTAEGPLAPLAGDLAVADGSLETSADTAKAVAKYARESAAMYIEGSPRKKPLLQLANDLDQQADAILATVPKPKKAAKPLAPVKANKPAAPVVAEPIVSAAQYVRKTDAPKTKSPPLFGQLFDDKDGNADARMKLAAGGSTAGGKTRLRSVLLLDRATGKVYSRHVWNDKGERVANSATQPAKGEKGYVSKGVRATDFEGGTQSSSWANLRLEEHNGLPRYEVLGYLHWNETDNANFNFRSVSTMAGNPHMKAAMDRLSAAPGTLAPDLEAKIAAAKALRGGTGGGKLGAGATKAAKGAAKSGKSTVEQVTAGEVAASEGSVVANPAEAAEAAEQAPGFAEALRNSVMKLMSVVLNKDSENYKDSLRVVATEFAKLRGNTSEADIKRAVSGIELKAKTPVKFVEELRAILTTTIQATLQQPGSRLVSIPEAHALFGHALSVLQRANVDVFLASEQLMTGITGEASARGVTLTDSQGRAMVGLVTKYLTGEVTTADVVRIYHEAAHVFTNSLPVEQQQMFHDAVSRLPWENQKWLSTGLGMDARVIANTPEEELSGPQLAMLKSMTPEQLTVLRGTSPSVVQLERSVEHLMALGIEQNAARDIMSQIIRFVKGAMLRLAVQLQVLYKGEGNVSENLARAYVENKWLQFINKDFANSPAAIAVTFRDWIGGPRTDAEKIAVYDNIDGAAQSYYYTPGTGFRETIPISTETTEGLLAQYNVMANEKTLGQQVKLMTLGPAVPVDSLQYLTGGIAFEELTLANQMKVLAVAKQEIDAVPLQKDKQGRLLAPTGQPSELDELQWKIVRTSFFKRWFGDWQADPANASKVINPVTMEPRVVYHGTVADNQFSTFSVFSDLGHHFGEFNESADRITHFRDPRTMALPANARIIPTFLNVRNPAPMRDNDWIVALGPDRLAREGIITPEQAKVIFNTDTRMDNADAMRAALMANGYDGAGYFNTIEGRDVRRQAVAKGQPLPEQTTWIAFSPEQIKKSTNKVFTPSARMQLTVQIGESVDPTIETNTRFATINHLAGVAAAIMQEPDVRRTIPSRFIKNGLDSFEQHALGVGEENVSSKKKQALQGKASTTKDLISNQPFAFEPATLINQLPVDTDGSSAQSRAMRDALMQLQKIETFIVKRLKRMRDRKEELDLVLANKKRVLTKAEQSSLDEANIEIPVFERVLNLENVGIAAQVDRMRGKLRTGFLFQVSTGATYYVPDSPTASKESVYASTKTVPANLYFGDNASKALAGDLIKMKQWLDNDANRQHGDVYESIATQFRKLSEVALNPSYTANRARMKRTAFDSLSNMLRGIGTAAAKYLGGRFYSLENAIQRYTADMEALGSQWSTAYDSIKGALNWSGTDQEFRRRVYNPVMEIAIATPDGTVDKFNKIVAAYNATRQAAYKLNDKAASAVKEMLRQTEASERKQQEMFEQLGHQVQDKKLGKGADGRIRQRSLIRQGVITGRLSVSSFFDSVWMDMKPLWTKTELTEAESEGHPLVNADDLWQQGQDAFRTATAPYFSARTLRDFVAPLVFGNKQTFPSPDGIDTGTPTLAAQANVRAAWNASVAVNPSGDITTFIAELNRLEGGTAGTEAEFAKLVMKSFTNMFAKMDKVANERAQGSKIKGMPVLPEEVMNARTADDFPPEWVEFSLYDQGSNKVLLHSLALNHAFGRDGLTSGEFKGNIETVRREVEALKLEYQHKKNEQGMKAKQIESDMGSERYAIAIAADDHLSMLETITEKMRFLVNPLSTQQGDLRLADEVLGLMAGATIQAPRSALQNMLDVLGPLYRQKFSPTAFKAIADSIKYTAADGASGFLEWFGIHTHFMAGFANRNRDLGAKDPDNYRSWRDSLTDLGTNNSLAQNEQETRLVPRLSKGGILLVRRMKAMINANPTDVVKELANKAMKTDFVPTVPGDQALAPKLRMLGIFKSTSMYIANGMVFGQYNAYKDVVMRGMEFINKSMDPAGYAKRLVEGEIKLTPEELGYTRKWMVLNDREAFDYMSDTVATKMGQGSLERMIGEAWLRTQKNPNDPVITDDQFARIRAVTLSDVQLTSMTTNLPADMRSSARLRAASVFLSWPYMAMTRFPSLFQTPQGQYTMQAAAGGAFTLMAGVIPLTLAASLGMDWFDEEALGKKQNIRDISADSLIPGMGPLVYPMATLERLARYGTAGLASELVNGVINQDDTRGALSADARVFALSQVHNLITTVGNIYRTENVDYQGVIRPFLHFMGANGVLQYAQMANNLAGMTNVESAINERISIANYLRAVGRDLKLSVIPTAQSSQGISNKVTPYIAQMELAAYEDDFDKFQEAFSKAVATYHEIHPEADDARAGVIRTFQARHPLRRVFRVNPTESEYRLILDNLNDGGREAVESGVDLFNKYLLKLGAKPFDGKVESKSVLPKLPSATSIIDSQLDAANAAYSSSFLD